MVNASYAVAVGYVAWDVYSVVKAEEKVEGGNMTRAVPGFVFFGRGYFL